jgi:pyruvate,water dikinase
MPQPLQAGLVGQRRAGVEGDGEGFVHSGSHLVEQLGQAPSDHIEIARYLVELGIDSISLTPDRVLKTMQAVREIEEAQGRASRH